MTSYLGAPLSSETMEWFTPPDVLTLVRKLSLVGGIGLDPATNEANHCDARCWLTPSKAYTKNANGDAIDVAAGDGLKHKWNGYGLVFVNPPYGRELATWAPKIAAEGGSGVELVALVPARTDTQWWRALTNAQSICFWEGRLKFSGHKDAAPFPSALVYWGDRARAFDRVFSQKGWCVKP